MSTTDNTEERKQTRPFAAWLQNVRNGELHHELSEKLAELATACIETGKVGTLTLAIKLRPNGDITLMAEDTVKVSAPEHDRATTLFFSDEEGNLQRTDPRQQELPLKEVQDGDGRTKLASVDLGTGEVKALHG